MAYGWTPTQIGDMTLGQILVYWMEAKDPGDTVKASQREVGEIQSRIQYQREWWERLLWRGVN